MRVFSFRNVTAVIDAVHEITGWGKGDDVVTATRNADAGSLSIGADGSGVVSMSADRSGEVTLKLRQTSSSNRYLQNRLLQFEAGTTTFVPINLTVTDVHRLDVITGINGFIKKLPEIKRGAEANEQEWTIVFEDLRINLGDARGAGTPSSLAEAAG